MQEDDIEYPAPMLKARKAGRGRWVESRSFSLAESLCPRFSERPFLEKDRLMCDQEDT